MKKCDVISLFGVLVFAVFGIWNVCDYIVLGEIIPLIANASVSLLFFLAAAFVCYARGGLLWLIIGGGSTVLFFCSNNVEGAYSNLPYAVQTAFAFLIGGAVTFLQAKERVKLRPFRLAPLCALLLVSLTLFGVGAGNVLSVRLKTGGATNELWAVPAKYDGRDCPESGRVERFDYQTKAYATDLRPVKKSAYVYLPYGYDESKSYDILYLLHGTGEREDYWLVGNGYNKIMLDNMIYYGDAKPLIVVTPTWYVEGDCADELDLLTYSFKDELRGDLMPAVEGKYATYAPDTTPTGFALSRDHRAFAGLSRGAVTTFHSVFNGSLDYFSWFGCYSACCTSAEEFSAGSRSEAFKDLPIHYLYNASGSFDFMLKEHVESMRKLLDADVRLTEENTSFDIFPIGYHSMDSWHIALYNSLQKFFQ